MACELENRMVVDSEWDEVEYRIPRKKRRRYEDEEDDELYDRYSDEME